MPKRMTATEKWDKEWFMSLSPKLKCLWCYINDRCDQAGMWEINYRLATMHIGEQITKADFNHFGDRVEFFVDKVWIVGHVDFQCGTLSEKSPAHKPVFKLLKKYSLLDRVLNRVSNTLQEKEKEIEKEIEEEKESKSRFENDSFSTAKEAYDEISSNYNDIEQAKLVLTNRGWRSATDVDVGMLLYHFVECQKGITKKSKDEVRQHFQNWINKREIDELTKLTITIRAKFQRQSAEVPRAG